MVPTYYISIILSEWSTILIRLSEATISEAARHRVHALRDLVQQHGPMLLAYLPASGLQLTLN